MKKRRKDGSNTRRERLREIMEEVKIHVTNNGGIMSLKKFQARIDWEMGLSPRKTLEYLETLKSLDVIDFDIQEDFISMGTDEK